MVKSIKKRSASHIYFGINKRTGELKHISEVPSGQKCNCICAACQQPLEARKGTQRRHHFAHISNYECMYASEVAIYKAFAEALKQRGLLNLPPVMLRFPAWHKPELLQEARKMEIDSVSFECEPLTYPPLLRVTLQGTQLRILLNFDGYYDAGNALLQKRYRTDTFPPKQKRNRGEREMYFVQNSNDAIVDLETFERVQKLRAKREVRRVANPRYFSNKMRCGVCGNTFRSKIQNNKMAVHQSLGVWNKILP